MPHLLVITISYLSAIFHCCRFVIDSGGEEERDGGEKSGTRMENPSIRIWWMSTPFSRSSISSADNGISEQLDWEVAGPPAYPARWPRLVTPAGRYN